MLDRKRQYGDDISVFLAACDAGSFVAASARLGLTASAVAKSVARLEQRLETRLFHRTTRRLAVTAEGALYRKTCQTARLQIENVEVELASMVAKPSGLVRLSLPPLLGSLIIGPALYDLCNEWPQLRFEISSSTAPVDLPGDGIDVVVRIGELPDLCGLTTRGLGVQAVTLCAAPGYFADRPEPRDVSDLSDHVLIASSQGGRVAPWHFTSKEGDRLSIQPQARLVLDGSLLTLSAIREGHGLGFLPYWLVADEIARGDLVPVLEPQVAGHMPVNLLWVNSPVLLPRTRVTIDAIVQATRTLFGSGSIGL